MKKRRLKKKYRNILKLIKTLVILAILVFIIRFIIKNIHNKTYIDNISFSNGFLIVELNTKDELYCILSDHEEDVVSNKWIKSELSKCVIPYNNEPMLYIKNTDKIVYSTNKEVFYDINIEDIYMAVNATYNPFSYLIGNSEKVEYSISKPEILSFNNGKIESHKKGGSSITFENNGKKHTINVTVTDLITKRPDSFDLKKENLACLKYTEEEAILLDEILKNRIDNAGYQTRAGVVEAARFLTLDFPYRINYFYENGRQTTNKVDGEGRYYHVGLYLSKDKYSSLTGSTYTNNKGVWGCSIKSFPVSKNLDNGLDCSGFVSWVLLNGGFDVKDVSAGWSEGLDLTDYGEAQRITPTLVNSNTIKVGDLVHSEKLGGHIGIIVGIDDEKYYVAQAIWYDPIGVVISEYKKLDLSSDFPHVILMDKYYINDGNLTNMW